MSAHIGANDMLKLYSEGIEKMSEKKIHSNSESKINLKDTKVIDYIFSNKNRHL